MKAKAVGLREAAVRVGMSYHTARRRVRLGTFPVPALRRVNPRDHHKFNDADIERYLDSALEDVRRSA